MKSPTPVGHLITIAVVCLALLQVAAPAAIPLGKLLELYDEQAVDRVAFSPDGQMAIATLSNGAMRVWNARTGRLIWKGSSYEGKKDIANCEAVFSPDSKTLLSSTNYGTARPAHETMLYTDFGSELRLWQMPSGKLLRKTVSLELFAYDMAFLPDKRTVAVLCGDAIRLWDTQTGLWKRKLTNGEFPWSLDRLLTFAANGWTVASQGKKGVAVWDMRWGKLKRRIIEGLHEGETINSLALSPDGKTLAAGLRGFASRKAARYASNEIGQVKLWSVQTGRLKRTLPYQLFKIDTVVFSPDGKTLVSIGTSALKFWDLRLGKLKRMWINDRGDETVLKLAFSPDSKNLIVSKGYPPYARVELWDVQTIMKSKR